MEKTFTNEELLQRLKDSQNPSYTVSASPETANNIASNQDNSDDNQDDETSEESNDDGNSDSSDEEKGDDQEDDSNDEDAPTEVASSAPVVSSREPSSTPQQTADPSVANKLINSLKPSGQGLAQAQQQQNNAVLANQLAQAGTLIGAGMAKSTPSKEALGVMQGNIAQAQNIVPQYLQQVEFQKHDPNSTMSTELRSYINAQFGTNLGPNTSATDILQTWPMIEKSAGYKNALAKTQATIQAKMQEGEKQRNFKEGENKKSQDASMARTIKNNEGKIAAAKAGQSFKLGKEERDAQVKAENDINTSRGKAAIQQAQRNMLATNNALKMFDEFPDPNKWTSSQISLFNTELAKIASQGVPSDSQMHELNNPTLAKSMAEGMQKISNVPVGAQQGKFIALNKKYLLGLQDVSKQVLKDNVGNVIKSYKDKLGNDAYKKIISRHSDMLGLYTPQQESGIMNVMKGKGISREDAISALIEAKKLPEISY